MEVLSDLPTLGFKDNAQGSCTFKNNLSLISPLTAASGDSNPTELHNTENEFLMISQPTFISGVGFYTCVADSNLYSLLAAGPMLYHYALRSAK